MTFWNVFLGVFAGILAGVFINLAIEGIRNYEVNRKMIKNLQFEIEFNIKKVDSFLNDLENYRKHISSDSPYEYFGKLNFSGLLKTTLHQMFSNRSIYKFYDYENIGRLQGFMASFQSDTVKSVNDSLNEIREIKDLDKMRRTASKISDYLEGGLKAEKDNLKMVKRDKYQILRHDKRDAR